MERYYTHYSRVPPADWRWPSFSPQELACRGTGKLMINEAALDRLQALRDRLGKPLIVNSAYRSPEHNKAVGGAKNSQHLQAKAFDVRMDNHDPAAFIAAAKAEGFTGIGTYPRQGFVHIDIGPARSWGTPFPARRATPAFAPEPPRPPERLRDDPEVIAATGAGLSGTIAAVAPVAGPVLGQLAPVAQAIAVLAMVAFAAWFVWQRRRRT